MMLVQKLFAHSRLAAANEAQRVHNRRFVVRLCLDASQFRRHNVVDLGAREQRRRRRGRRRPRRFHRLHAVYDRENVDGRTFRWRLLRQDCWRCR